MGVNVFGIEIPYIRQGDDIKSEVIKALRPYKDTMSNNSVVGITESVVARAQGNYVTVDKIAEEIKRVMGNPEIITIYNCIYSRNRFAMILKAIAKAAARRVRIYMPYKDEVGNVGHGHPFTKMNYVEYYRSIVEAQGKDCVILCWPPEISNLDEDTIYCGLHDYETIKKSFPNLFTLADFFKDKCKYGLLGSNKANEATIKLFPNSVLGQELCNDIKTAIKNEFNLDIVVCLYGDGCFKDPVGGIWEFADPVTMPAYTDAELIESTPNELKLKYFLDSGFSNDEVSRLIKENKEDLKGNMRSQGTTPRLYRDLLASLMDLTSGSGDRGTPVVLINNYFKNDKN